ncbi:MAG: glycerol-3-phosphate 1-O-acyltransferase PlsY [Erysipelotrichaceae bacterium]|jgi:glycerol-3-phosphate acyltransferase PlsY|nr:glycerol-3-phosphate 1-O-acyltransferase PlsY [Erysipelotrichaceae bacterium]
MQTLITIFLTLGFLLMGYLFGSISWGVILSKRFKKQDIRDLGSGNAGATNVGRVFGKKIGALVMILDIFKTIIPVSVAFIIYYFAFIQTGLYQDALLLIDGVPLRLFYFAGFGSVIGHVYPLFYDFRGGKAVAGVFGLVLAINWLFAILIALTFLLILKITKYVSLSSITSSVVISVMFLFGAIFLNVLRFSFWEGIIASPFLDTNYEAFIIIAISSIILIARHHTNITRLINKTERKITWLK